MQIKYNFTLTCLDHTDNIRCH